MSNFTGKPPVDLIISGAIQVLTCVPTADDPIGRRDNVTIAIVGENIVAVGPHPEIENRFELSSANKIDATEKIIAPGFVDSHTHLLFGGTRVLEYAARMTMDALALKRLNIPTGILATVEMTRGTNLEAMEQLGLERIVRMLHHGTTTVESKTGYGLSLDQEWKLLEANLRLKDRSSVDLLSTFLGAHAFPPEMSHKRYLDILINDMIPKVGGSGLADFCDVYCDEGYYSVSEARQILEAGLGFGLKAKIHVDAYSDIGGSDMAANLGVVSADHLNYTTRKSMRKLANAGVIGVVMPLLDFAVAHQRPFNSRAMQEEGMKLALATDFCPACWVESMQMVMAFACRIYHFSPEEALLAATVGGASALGLDDRGTIEPGKIADLQIWDIPTFEDIIYRIGNNAVVSVIKRGKVCF
jgi:imidazolonepropionase